MWTVVFPTHWVWWPSKKKPDVLLLTRCFSPRKLLTAKGGASTKECLRKARKKKPPSFLGAPTNRGPPKRGDPCLMGKGKYSPTGK